MTDRKGNGLQPDVFPCSVVGVVFVGDCVLFQRMAQNSRIADVMRHGVDFYQRCKMLGVPHDKHLPSGFPRFSSTANCFREAIEV